MERTKRINRNHLYMQMAYLISLRSQCRRLQVGCVIVRNKRVISSGCNGPLNSLSTGVSSKGEFCQCKDNTCGDRESIHAEMNALAYAAKEGLSVMGSTIYVTDSPCFHCAKLILQAGITQVIYWREYRDNSPIIYLRENDIQVSKYSGELQEYSDKDL